MAVKIIDPIPSKEVVKEVLCKMCGVKLSYVPFDVKYHDSEYSSDYSYIKCPNCKEEVEIS
jgi:ribosomal protein S27E